MPNWCGGMSCRCATCSPEPRTATSGSRTGSRAVSRRSRTPVTGQDRFSFGVIGDFGIGTPAARANLRRLSADPAVDLAITTGDNAQIYGTRGRVPAVRAGPLAEPDRHEAVLAQRRQPRLLQPAELPALLRAAQRRPVLQLHLRRRAVPGARLQSLRPPPARLAPRHAGRLHCALQGCLLPSPAVVERARVRRSHAPSAPQRFVPILQRGGVDLVLNGHVQNYERSKPLRSGRRSRRGIVYVVTGGGGAQLERVRHEAPAEVVCAPRRLLPPPAHPGARGVRSAARRSTRRGTRATASACPAAPASRERT